MPFLNMRHRLVRHAQRMCQEERGALSVEFVIIFPALIMLLIAMFWFSMLIATISDVQQLSNDLTRQALRYSQISANAADICTQLEESVQPTLMQDLIFLKPERVTGISCAMTGAAETISVAVTYDLSGFANTSVNEVLGWDITNLTRRATLVL